MAQVNTVMMTPMSSRSHHHKLHQRKMAENNGTNNNENMSLYADAPR